MHPTRHGKISRLPRHIRHQLNTRLLDGESGRQLVLWLNALPEVQAVLAANFEGRPVNEQNLSDWKQGGYRDWLSQQEALELSQHLAEDATELQPEDRPPLTDTLALWLTARYAVASRQVAHTDGPEGWRLLRELCADVVELRRGDHSAQRLRLDRDQFAASRECTRREQVEQFHKWASDPDIREQICRGFHTRAEMIEQLGRLMFGDVWDEWHKPGSLFCPESDEPTADPPSTPPAEPDQGGVKVDQGESR